MRWVAPWAPPWSLRFRLLLLVLAAVLPLLGLVLLNTAAQHRQATAEAEANVGRLAQLAAADHRQHAESAHLLLAALASVPELFGTDVQACHQVLRSVLEASPRYANLGVISPNGLLVCSALPFEGSVDLSDRPYFRQAVATRTLAVGEYQVGRVTDRPTINCGYPVYAEDGRLRSVIFAALDLGWLTDFARDAPLPPSSALLLLDRQGTVLLHFPNAEFVGTSLAQTGLWREVQQRQEGPFAARGLDEVERLYSVVPLFLHESQPAAFLLVGVAREAVLAEVNAFLRRSVTALTVVALLASALAWTVGDLTLVRRLRALAAAARKIAAGDLGTRTGLPHSSDELGELTRAFDDMSASLERAERQKERHLQRLAALRTIDLVILGSLELRTALNVVADQALAHLSVDAVAVHLLHERAHALECIAARGFPDRSVLGAVLPWGHGLAGPIPEMRRPLALPNAPQDAATAISSALEGFRFWYATPIQVKGQIVGLIELYKRDDFNADHDWLNFCEALAGQASIAVQTARLFQDLHEANAQLTAAYEATLAGWVKALDLRDRETEEHSIRVPEMTVHLAQALGVKEELIPHIRRGALLHDVGKMAIPDSILLKPGPLNDFEWHIMRQHPVYAHEWLSSIPFLQPALNIPYCHHEKWDGTGYPRGLKEEEIPLPARIFAVIDVWDALTSDRPYRPAWPLERAEQYIREQAGRHFDPRIADLFLRLDWSAFLRHAT